MSDTNQPKEGGPAFPTLQEHGFNQGAPGMTLLDHFAGLAMQGELSAMAPDQDGCSGLPTHISDKSLDALTTHWYRIAKSMLKARSM